MKRKNQILIGLTGGPGVGKTEVARQLSRRGIPVISADKIGHYILENNRLIKAQVKAILSQNVFDNQGVPNRKLIGKIIFSNPDKFAKFNRVVHPILLRTLKKELNRISKTNKRFIVVDAALIYEWGIADWFDIMIVVDSSRQNRLKRLVKSGLPKIRAIERIASQIPQSDKKALADLIVTNNSSLVKLAAETKKLIKVIKKDQLTHCK